MSVAAAAVVLALGQFCPSYTASSPEGMAAHCTVTAVNGTNPTVAEWQGMFSLVAAGPSAWGTQGPSVANIGQGCGKPMLWTSVPARFPCEVLKAIAMQESGWKQFCVPTTPSSQVGGTSRTIIAFDCGYGVGQVTSGMRTFDPAPSFDRAKVASDPMYNLATGTQILAEKWRATSCVGDNQPSIVEDWYAAAWAYNGLAYVNNPNNPAYSSTRGVWDPAVGGNRPYQEKVFGWLEHPPTAAHWPVLAVAYPKLTDVGAGNAPPPQPDPSCASPTSCASTRATHVSACLGSAGGGAGGGGAGGAGGGSSGGDAGGAAAGGGVGAAGGTGSRAVVLEPVDDTLGPEGARGCGCSSAPGLGLCLLALMRRRR